MKNIQKIRLAVQLLCVILTVFGFFTNFQVTMVIFMLMGIIGGVYYCGWICPFGTLQDIASKIGSALKIKKRKMPKAIQKYLKYSRYILFATFTIFSLDILYSLFVYDPRVNLLQFLDGNYTGLATLIVMISFLVIGVFFDRPFCNYLCIEGAKFGAFSSLRVVTIKRDVDSCVGCKQCDKACPMNIEVSKTDQVQSIQCINCFKCVSACPVENTLTYGKISLTKTMKIKYKIAIGVLALAIVIVLISIIRTGELPFNINKDAENESAITEEIIEPIEIKDTEKNIESEEITEIDETTEKEESEVIAEATETAEPEETTETGTLTEEELAAIGDAEGIEDGVYEGSGDGFNGKITLEVTVVNQMITKIEVTKHSEDAKFYNRAEPTVTEDIIDSQSADVDTVSGATYSSRGIIEAVTNAVESAR